MPPHTLVVPEYGRRSLAEVLPALLAALGTHLPNDDQPASDLRLPPVRAAAVLLVDGLGADLLRRYATDAPFLASLSDAGPLTAGFPSSTSTSLASLGTGRPPGAHGIVGITFRADGELLDTLRWMSHTTDNPVDLRSVLPPEQVQPLPTALQLAEEAGVDVTVVSARVFEGSGLTRAALRGGRYRGVHALGDLAAEVIAALNRPGRRLCYGYHADLDRLGHLHGPGSMPWRLQLAHVDRLVATIAEHLPRDALLAVTGDHGMVRVDRTYDIDVDEQLQAGVRLVGGDPRSRHVYVEPGASADVLATWRELLGSDARVVPGEQAVAEGWFGPVDGHVADRIGDVVAAAVGDAAIIRSVTEPGISTLPGQHGGLTAAEQHVPLLLVHRQA